MTDKKSNSLIAFISVQRTFILWHLLYVNLQIPHRQQDLSTSLPYPIYHSLLPNINPHTYSLQITHVFITQPSSFFFRQASKLPSGRFQAIILQIQV